MPSWHILAYCGLLLLVIPAAAAGLLREVPLREVFERGVPAVRLRPYYGALVAFALFTWIQQYFLPRPVVSVLTAAVLTATLSTGFAAAYLAVFSRPGRRVALPLAAIVMVDDVVALLIIAHGYRSGVDARPAFKPLLFLAIVASTSACVWIARRVSPAGPTAASRE